MKATLRFKRLPTFFYTIIENVTPLKFLKGDPKEDDFIECEHDTYLSEQEFYKMFLYMRNAFAKTAYKDDEVDRTVTPVNVEYMSLIMAKSMDYTIPAKSRNSVQSDLAAEMGKNPQSAYSAIHRLKKAGYLVKTEDNLIEPNRELQTLRKITKKHLKSLGRFPVSYLLNVIVYNEQKELTGDEVNGGDKAESS